MVLGGGFSGGAAVLRGIYPFGVQWGFHWDLM
jgi:hypothetical protein